MSDQLLFQLTKEELAERKRQEYDRITALLKERVEGIKAERNDLPEFVVRSSSIQLGPYILYLHFEQQQIDATEFVLFLTVGQPKNSFFAQPPPVSYALTPVLSDDHKSIVWRGNIGGYGAFTSADVAASALDELIDYYERRKPK